MASAQPYKRIPLTPSTWEQLSLLKKPGETFDHLISDLIEERQRQDIIRHVMNVAMGTLSLLTKQKKPRKNEGGSREASV